MSNQSGVQQAVRNATSTALSYQGDWHALFDADGIAAGTWNERMLAWINAKLGSTYANIGDAQQAYAVDQGFYNWSSMDTVVLSVLTLSSTMVGEDASIGAVVGALSVVNGTGSYTYTITADPDSKFVIDGDDLELADTLDWSADASHSVTIEADNGISAPLVVTFTVTVLDLVQFSDGATVQWADGSSMYWGAQ